MNANIWEKTILAWVNSLITCTPIQSIHQINDSILKDIIKRLKFDFESSPVEFLKTLFPNSQDFESFASSSDYLCAITLLLIYISFSNKTEFEEVKNLMCTQLDNSTQINFAGFLMTIAEHGDPFAMTFDRVKHEITDYVEKNSVQPSIIGDGMKTPVKNYASDNSFDSPLQGFFQTPKGTKISKHCKSSSKICGDGDHLKLIKKLTNQLVEEESEKSNLQEQLNIHIQRCNDYETKLRNKIEEINQIKSEWEIDSKKNESELTSLKTNMSKKLENEKKLRSELNYLEKYNIKLESDLSKSVAEKNQLEYQLKKVLENCAANDTQLKELNELNVKIQEALDNKEKELVHLKEEYEKFYKDEKAIDVSCLSGSLNESYREPENMNVVVEKLLQEKVEENGLLKTTIEDLKKENNNLLVEIKSLNEKLALKTSDVHELHCLNIELNLKLEEFNRTNEELFEVQNKLITAQAELSKLEEEHNHLNQQHQLLQSTLLQREQSLNSKVLIIQVSFVKLAKDFIAVQQRLEKEIKDISRLTLDTDEKKDDNKVPELVESKEAHNSESLSICQKYTEGDSKEVEKEEIFSSNQLLLFDSEKWEKIKEVLQYFDNQHFDWSEYKISMENTCSKIHDNIIALRMKIIELEDRKNKFIEQKIRLENLLKDEEAKTLELKLSQVSEVKMLSKELEVKNNKIEELQLLIKKAKKFQEDLILENETLKEAAKITKERSTRLMGEGDFTSTPKLDLLEIKKIIEPTRDQQEFNDSLEEAVVCSKTFDVVHVEDKSIGNKTFSVKKEAAVNSEKANKSGSVWIVSPPSKFPPKPTLENNTSNERRRIQGESWVVPLTQPKAKKVSSANDLRIKTEPSRAESSFNLTKSSSLSSIIESDYPHPTAVGSKTSTVTSFFSVADLSGLKKRDDSSDVSRALRIKKNYIQKVKSAENGLPQNLNFVKRSEDSLGDICSRAYRDDDDTENLLEMRISALRKEVIEFSKERDRLRMALLESEDKRKKDKEMFEKNQEIIRQNIAAKYENQLQHLKNEMKLLHNRELAKHKAEQSKINSELQEQNKRYKEHINELRNQLWDLGEKLLQEQKSKKDLEKMCRELKKKLDIAITSREFDAKTLGTAESHRKESVGEENIRLSGFRQMPNGTFPTIPTEDEDEVFDNRFLEDMKAGHFKTENPESRLMELQYRNSLCLPHMKSSYPGETQFHNPAWFKENDLKLGLLQFGQESQSLTDSDHSMTKSLLPENKGKKKEQTSYKRPGPPTPSKNGGRLSIQASDMRLTPRKPLKELSEQVDVNKLTPNCLKGFLYKNVKNVGLGGKDENSVPVTPRKLTKFFRKPFGARDH